MAGQSQGNFRELISPFLKGKIKEAAERFGEGSPAHRALTLQYVRDPLEEMVDLELERRRHYEAELFGDDGTEPLRGVERLYKRTALLQPTTACAAHCRWCVRGQYPTATLPKEAIVRAAKYFGSPGCRDDLREVLLTGGDPLTTRSLLEFTIDQIVAHAPNIRVVRIGSRVPFQDPKRIDDALVAALTKHRGLQIELGTHVNHPIEFWPESVAALARLQERGLRIYNQHPLLRGVNDDLATLTTLYDVCRENGIEAHYLFHCIPMRGMSHHRTTVDRGLELIRTLVSSGAFSGRAKPKYVAMTDVGKVQLYEGVILDRRDGRILMQTGYSMADRRRWNPSSQLPDSAVVDEKGLIRVWYQDAAEDVALRATGARRSLTVVHDVNAGLHRRVV